MKVIGVSCTAKKGSLSCELVKKVLEGASAAGHKTEFIMLRPTKFSGCIACYACKKEGSTGCVLQDDMTQYFEALSEADVVVFGAGNYMGWPQGQAWDFVNRHFCLHRSVSKDCRIEAGKRLIPCFAQGMPSPDGYRGRYEALVEPFKGWGFDIQEMLICTSVTRDTIMDTAYNRGLEL